MSPPQGILQSLSTARRGNTSLRTRWTSGCAVARSRKNQCPETQLYIYIYITVGSPGTNSRATERPRDRATARPRTRAAASPPGPQRGVTPPSSGQRLQDSLRWAPIYTKLGTNLIIDSILQSRAVARELVPGDPTVIYI